MADDSTPKRPDNLTPDAPVHPLMRRPPEPDRARPETIPMQVNFTGHRRTQLIFTWGLIAINGLIFALGIVSPSLQNDLFFQFADQPNLVLNHGEYWRLFTSMFLHANVMHIAFNMLSLYSIGQIIEKRFGRARYLLIYLLGGLAGSILSVSFNSLEMYSVGASGAVFAIFGAEAAFLLVNWRSLDRYGMGARERLRQVIFFAALNFFVGFLGAATGGGIIRIDNWAHVGGFLGGAILSYLICPRYHISHNVERGVISITDTRPFKRDEIRAVLMFVASLIVVLLIAVQVK